MKQKSFIKRTIFMLTIQMVLLICVLLFFILSTYNNANENLNQLMDNFVQVYGNELDNKIENGDRILERLVYKNSEYEMLQSEKESERFYATVNLKELLEESLLNDNNVDMVVVAEANYESCIDSENTTVSPTEKNAIRAFALDTAKMSDAKAVWKIKRIKDTPYIYKMYSWHGRVAGVFMKAENFMSTAADSKLDDMTALLIDENNCIQSYYGEDTSFCQIGKKLDEVSQDNIGYLFKTYSLAQKSMMVYTCISLMGIGSQIKSSMLVFLAFICLLLIFSFLLIQYIRSEILFPMEHMQEKMTMIQDGNLDLRMDDNYNNREFTLLKNAFNRLMDEIMGLKIQTYEKQIELQETELKCRNLQIRPHFFLNAMTTISSLSMQAKNEEIKRYIEALSKNIRYMFKSGLHTVTLNEEIRHVENYFEMQELKYPGCVFNYVDVEQDVVEWKIPQMLIHTIVENEYKYAVSVDDMLTILIKASKVLHNGEEMLLLEIEDDGKGYPEDVLERINHDIGEENTEGSRVGLTSVKRIIELMYDQKHLFEISNIIPHGCLNHFYIPGKPTHELKHEKITMGEQSV